MRVKCLILMSLMLVRCSLTSGGRSFVVVTDTTASMREEITILRNSIGTVVKSLEESAGFVKFILVPFSDPEVGMPKISASPEGLVNFINDLRVSGGNDCLENSLAAVVKALEVSSDNSIIFLFTDAPAKDIKQLPIVQALCQQRRPQIVIFLTGKCVEEAAINVNVFYEIAKMCSGMVFNLDIHTFPQIFKYMKEIAKVDWTNIRPHEEFAGTKQFNLTVDKYTKDIIVAVTGNYPVVHVLNSEGLPPADTTLITTLNTKDTVVVHLVQPDDGNYTVEVCSRVQSRVTFYMRKTLDFNYGFAPTIPRDLQETSSRPVLDAITYLIIEQPDSDIELFLIEADMGFILRDAVKKIFQPVILNESKRLYMIQASFKLLTKLTITIHGRNKKTYEVIKGTTKSFYVSHIPFEFVSDEATVKAIILTPPLVEFKSNVSLFCKVTGTPKPDIWWEDENANIIDSEDFLFEGVSTYASYATFYNATSNNTIYCKAKNSKGEGSLSADLFVHRESTFEVLQNPADTTVEYGTEGRLYCEANAYPEAVINWFHNGSSVENSDNVQIIPEENLLLLKSMSVDDTGAYTCEINNEIESRTFTATVYISGLEEPSIELKENEFILHPGDPIEIHCNIAKGNPRPSVTWNKIIDDQFVDVPDGVYVEENIFKITSATVDHRGIYVCEASNVQGKDTKEVAIKVQYPPKIKLGDANIMVKAGESVQLECDVDAEPKAVVHWDMYQGDVIIAFDRRHYTDDHFTHRFIAQPDDNGIYQCIAENAEGRAERRITVNIVETPYIEPLKFRTLTVRAGGSVVVPCNVLVGRPMPSTRWEFISSKSSTTVVISRKTTTQLDLLLRNVSKENEGMYQCVAENVEALDFIKFNLIVQ